MHTLQSLLLKNRCSYGAQRFRLRPKKNTHHPLDEVRANTGIDLSSPINLYIFRKVDIKLTLTLRCFDFATQLPTMHFTIDNDVACYITSNLLEAGPKYVINKCGDELVLLKLDCTRNFHSV